MSQAAISDHDISKAGISFAVAASVCKSHPQASVWIITGEASPLAWRQVGCSTFMHSFAGIHISNLDEVVEHEDRVARGLENIQKTLESSLSAKTK